jgi:2-aminoadipate transaminase
MADSISFARGAPSLDIVDVDGLREAASRAFTNDPAGATAYGTSIGYPKLRAWIAERHGVEPERVLVTNGSMQADAFLFEHLVEEGDDVVVERPTYDRTLLSLRERGARVHQVELLPDGIDTDALAALLDGAPGTGGTAGGSEGNPTPAAPRVRPKLAHIIPNFQNPAGYTLSPRRRRALLALAAEHDFVVFEDDPYVELHFSAEKLPTMLSMDPERVVYASSFSKTVCPGIRVGYLVGPPDLIAAIAKLATNAYISPNMVAQSIVYEFCASGALERSIETVRTALAKRARTLDVALRRELPEAEFVPPEGGYFMWVTLPEGTDVAALHKAATELGVVFVKGTDFLLEGGENTLRLAYSGVTPEQIEEGVTRLAAAVRSLQGAPA